MHIPTVSSSTKTSSPVVDQPPASPAEVSAVDRDGDKDRATISTAGKAALAHEQSGATSQDSAPSAQAQADLASRAVQAGKSLLHSNPEKYRQVDPDGDGKLTIAEAKRAGLVS